MTERPKLVIITPVRNEADYIGKTLSSVVAQSLLPFRWLIVDDGSTDRTAAMVREYAQQHAFIRLLQRPDQGAYRLGGGVVQAFNHGLAQLEEGYDYIAKLDGDLAFGPDTIARLLERFAADKTLGIASGLCYLETNKGLVAERSDPRFPRGPFKCYSRDCFAKIGGLYEGLGWDALDVIRAQLAGFHTQAFADIQLIHLRPTGGRALVTHKRQVGRTAYRLGYNPLFFLLRCLYRSVHGSPAEGPAMLAGYLGACLTRKERIVTQQEMAWLRRFQRAKLRRLVGGNKE